MMSDSPVLPVWFVLPLAVVAMLVIGTYAMLGGGSEVPASRRRIRGVNNVVMLVTVPVLAFAFGVVPPAEERLFVLTWLVAVGLLGLVTMLAMLDAFNNVRVHQENRRALRRQAWALREIVEEERRDARREQEREQERERERSGREDEGSGGGG